MESITSWSQAKRLIIQMAEPRQEDFADVMPVKSGSHAVKGGIHQLSEYVYHTNVEGYLADYHYATCPQCQQIRFKKWVLYNNKEGTVFCWEMVRFGKNVEEEATPESVDWTLNLP